MSLLTICQDAADEVGIAQPATIVSNTNKDARQLFRFVKKETKHLLEDHEWEIVSNPEGSITGDGAATAFALPTDYHRIVSDTMWSRSENRSSYMPVGAKEWAFLKGWDIVTTLNRRGRIVDGMLEFYQIVPSGTVINFEYIEDRLWDIAATGTPKAAPTIDTDVFRLDEEAVTMGVVWRYKKTKERAWKADFQEYIMKLEFMKGQEKSATSLNSGVPRRRVWGLQVKDSGYGT